MTISRRQLLRDGVRVTAAITVGPALFQWRACGASSARRGVRLSPPGAMCAGRVVAAQAPQEIGPPLHPDTLARFVDPLPVPRVLEPEGMRPDPRKPDTRIAYYRVPMREISQRVHRDIPLTKFWSYGGEVPGPTIETRSGRPFIVEWVNELPNRHFLPLDHTLHGAHADQPEVRTVVHVHGAKAPPESDGHPDAWITPSQSAVYRYPNQQDAAMLWYHDHAMGIERLNQYAGLFGVLFVRDEVEERLDLPNGALEIPLVLCDRLFRGDGRLFYPTSGDAAAPWVSEVRGDSSLVNGKLFPYLEVEPRRYRFRVLNAANSRIFELSRSDQKTLHQIGSDQGLLPAPVAISKLTLGPAERADVIVDFADSAGQNVVLQNQTVPLLQFRIAARPPVKSPPLPARLRSIQKIPPSAAVQTRTLTLDEYSDSTRHRMLMLLNGKYWRDPVTEKPRLGSVEIWSLVNLTEDTHPIHLHLVRFQILDRQLFDADEFRTSGAMRLIGKPQAPEPGELGWKDTVRAHPGAITRIIARFEGYVGAYVWHCHLLEHAANEMMRPFEVIAG
jgi:spore coat protein A